MLSTAIKKKKIILDKPARDWIIIVYHIKKLVFTVQSNLFMAYFEPGHVKETNL